jgi:hypothetical protein
MDPDLKLVLEELTRRCCEEIRQAFADIRTSFSESRPSQQPSPPFVPAPEVKVNDDKLFSLTSSGSDADSTVVLTTHCPMTPLLTHDSDNDLRVIPIDDNECFSLSKRHHQQRSSARSSLLACTSLTLSTAGGAAVRGASVLGYGTGTTWGGLTCVAAYRVCFCPINSSEFSNADVLAGFEVTIRDGLHVISASVGSDAYNYHDDAVAIGLRGSTPPWLWTPRPRSATSSPTRPPTARRII